MSKKLAVIGSPVAHSKSPAIHTKFAADLGLDYTYEAVEVTAETLADFVSRAKAGEFAGFNVTMPLKEAIIPHLAAIDGAAKACGSVNTVVVRGGELHGYSTDGVGTVAALREQISDLRGKSALILGTGGAAKAAAFALNEAGCTVTALSRRAELPRIAGAVTRPWAELATLAASAYVIINATPQGMHGNVEFDDFNWLQQVKNETIVFDFVYNPIETTFLVTAKSHRLTTIGGLRLLLLQAAASFELFTGVAPASVEGFFA
ncbi:MAG: shikimate dehydrogenase [Oscillospiraceae bacterium]|jgi:shikimate dehydrogenase|nr:shikimate dehydrogenase [Oscillospiraceae bacterium]